MKRYFLFSIAACLLLTACAKSKKEPTPSPAPTAYLEAEVVTPGANYLNPLTYTALPDADAVFAQTRIRITLPPEIQDASYALVTTVFYQEAVEAVFVLDNVQYYYRAAYTPEWMDLADDLGEYATNEVLENESGSYRFQHEGLAGKSLWYDANSGTSRSLYCPLGFTIPAMQRITAFLMANG
jgi:hypothetical protein